MIGGDLISIIQSCRENVSNETLYKIREALQIEPQAAKKYFIFNRNFCHIAISKKNLTLLEIFALEADIDLHEIDTKGKTPLDLAENEETEKFIAKLEIELRRRHDSKGEHLHDILINAAKMPVRKDELTKAIRIRLQQASTEANETTFLGRNACHWAVFLNLPQYILKILVIEGGANLDVKDDNGCLPIDLTTEKATKKYLRLLQNKRRMNDYHFFFQEPVPLPEKRRFKKKKYSTISFKKLNEEFELLSLQTHKKKAVLQQTAPPLKSSSTFTTPLLEEGDHPHKYNPSISRSYSPRSKLPAALDDTPIRRVKRSSSAENTRINESGSSSSMVSNDKQIKSLGNSPRHLFEEDANNLIEIRKKILVAMEKDGNQMLQPFLNSSADPNGINHEKMPYLLQAFLVGAMESFLILIKLGAKVDHQKMGLSSLLSVNSKELMQQRITFLIEVRNRLIDEIDFNYMNKTKSHLSKEESQFHYALICHGLSEKGFGLRINRLSTKRLLQICNIDPVVKKKASKEKEDITKDKKTTKVKFEQALAEKIYQCCSQINPNSKEMQNNFNLIAFRETVIGILSFVTRHQRTSVTLLFILYKLYPHFGLTQKLLALLLIKEMVLYDNFSECIHNHFFCNFKLNSLFYLTTQDGFSDLNQHLVQIIKYQRVIMPQALSACFAIDSVLQESGLFYGSISLENLFSNLTSCDENGILVDAQIIANDLRAFTLRFYQNVHPREFLNKAWVEKNVNRNKEAPSIVDQLDLFNNIANFLQAKIVTTKTNEERTMLLMLCILIAEELLNDPLPDYNMAMAISSVINDSSICRLKKAYAALPTKVQAKWEAITVTLSQLKNYKNQREQLATRSDILPFLGIYNRDFTFINDENTSKNRYPLLGHVYLDLFTRQNHLRTVSIPLKTNLLALLKLHVNLSDEVLYGRSQIVEPLPLMLNEHVEYSTLQNYLAHCLEQHLPIDIHYSGKIIEGKEAFKVLYQWFEKGIYQKRLDFHQASNLLELICKAQRINPKKYQTRLKEAELKTSAKPITTQFEMAQEESTQNITVQATPRASEPQKRESNIKNGA